jgi:hypothetical protein
MNLHMLLIYNTFKEIGLPGEYFLKAYKIRSVLHHVHAQIVFTILACLVQEKNKYKVSACFFEITF